MKATLTICGLVTAMVSSPVQGQGDLVPPGAPAPMMKTLDQIEPRSPIAASSEITQPGSYYLTQSIAGVTGAGIRIKSSNVTLDLNGFSVSASTAQAIWVDGAAGTGTLRNVRIHNGTVEGPGDGLMFSNVRNLVVENLRIAHTENHGIADVSEGFTNSNIAIRNCIIDQGGLVAGIALLRTTSATIASCSINNGTGDGIRFDSTGPNALCVSVRNCSIASNAGFGISNLANQTISGSVLITNCDISNCGLGAVRLTEGGGVTTLMSEVSARGCAQLPGAEAVIEVGSGAVIDRCAVSGSTLPAAEGQQHGIRAGAGSVLTNTSVSGNYFSAPFAIALRTGDGSAVHRCTASGNFFQAESATYFAGIDASSPSSVTDCVASSNQSTGPLSAISANSGSVVTKCVASGNWGHGVSAQYHTLISRNVANSNKLNGIRINGDNLVLGNQSSDNGNDGDGAGIHAEYFGSFMDGNQVSGNDRGIDADGIDNMIFRNTSTGNTTNFDLAAGNHYGPIIIKGPSPAFSGSGIHPGTMLDDHPAANITGP